ncbi:MAG: hypothetical protein ACKO04_03960 [Actinomycetes bacterium]
MPSLDEFAEQRHPARRYAWWWRLPEQVREELVESSAPTEVCVLWLQESGWPDATFGKVDPFRRKARRERQAQPE